jgi:hypothetical protein
VNGIHATRYAWDVITGAGLDLSPADRLVLLCYADHASTSGEAWPAASTVGVLTGLHPGTVRRSVHRLADLAVVELRLRGRRPTLVTFPAVPAPELIHSCAHHARSLDPNHPRSARIMRAATRIMRAGYAHHARVIDQEQTSEHRAHELADMILSGAAPAGVIDESGPCAHRWRTPDGDCPVCLMDSQTA